MTSVIKNILSLDYAVLIMIEVEICDFFSKFDIINAEIKGKA